MRREILAAIIRTIAQEGRTVLFSSHLLDEVERVSDHVALIDRGQIVLRGSLDEIKALHHRLTLRFDEPVAKPPALLGSTRWEGFGREWTVVCPGSIDEICARAAGIGAADCRGREPHSRRHLRCSCGFCENKRRGRLLTMHFPALAIGYGIWVRHQFGFLICAAGLAVMALCYPLLFAYSRAPAVLLASTIPLIGIFTYVLNATIFAQEPGSLASSYPRHLLVMPLKSWSLVFWPMFFGSLIALSLLFVTVKIVYRTSGMEIPLGLPALGLVVIVSWFQAIAWFPLNMCDSRSSRRLRR